MTNKNHIDSGRTDEWKSNDVKVPDWTASGGSNRLALLGYDYALLVWTGKELQG